MLIGDLMRIDDSESSTQAEASSRFNYRLAGIAAGGLIASIAVVAGGVLAGASASAGGRLWTVPTIPVRPVASLVPALALFYGGLILLVRAWLALRRHHLGSQIAMLSLVGIVAVWSVPLLVGPPLGSRDVYAYAAQGRAADQGHDVYVDGPSQLSDDDPVLAPVDPLYRDAPVVYGPVFVYLSAKIASHTGDEVVQAVLAYRMMAIFGLVVAAFAVNDLARGLGRDPVDALILGFANPLVLLHLVSGAHNESVMLGLLLSGVAVARRSRLRHVGIGLASLAAAIKLPAILAVAFIGWSWGMETPSLKARASRVALTATEAFVVIALAGRLTGWGWGWVDAITGADPVEAYLSISSLLGGAFAVATGLEMDAVLTVARLSGIVLAAALTTWLLVQRHHRWPVALAWSLLIAAVLHPTTQPWYLTWGILLLAACYAGDRNRGFMATSAIAVFVVMPVGPQLGWLVMAEARVLTLVVAGLALVVLTMNPAPASPPLFRTGLDPGLVSIVVPTRHEAANIEPLVESLAQLLNLKSFNHRMEIVFADDSDDGTPAEVERVSHAYAASGLTIRPMHRCAGERWGGLSGAVVDAMGHARGATMVVMDGDCQHPPPVVADLVSSIGEGADLAVASRRSGGGSDGTGLGPARSVLSRGAAGFTSAMFPSRLARVSDPMSGFFAVRLGSVDLSRLEPDGFKILVELAVTHPELAVNEVPFVFARRAQGASKASLGQGLRFAGHLVDLRLRTSRAWSGAPISARSFRSV